MATAKAGRIACSSQSRPINDGYLHCKGSTYPAQLKYKMLADLACEKITAGIVREFVGQKPIVAVLDPYNPTGTTRYVNFNTSKTDRWETDSRKCHINWVILDSDWEGEFCRVAEQHPKVRAYVKNHNLGFEVPYRFGSEMRMYRPDFIVLVDGRVRVIFDSFCNFSAHWCRQAAKILPKAKGTVSGCSQ